MEEPVITLSKEMRGGIYDTARRCAEEEGRRGKEKQGGKEKKVNESVKGRCNRIDTGFSCIIRACRKGIINRNPK